MSAFGLSCGDSANWQDREFIVKALEAAAPHIQAQTLLDAVHAFPLETITAPDNAVVWLMRRAEEIRGKA